MDFLPKLTLQDKIAAENVSTGPKTKSGSPMGLNQLARTQPKVNPMTAGKPSKQGVACEDVFDYLVLQRGGFSY